VKRILILTVCSIAMSASTVFGQTIQSPHDHAGHSHTMLGMTKAREIAQAGPHGGSLKQTGNLQIETIVSFGGMQMFVYDHAGRAVSVDQGRGAVSIRVQGNAKRYRYDLLPDGKGALTAAVNLSRLAGRQIEVDIHLVGISRGAVSFNEVATVPASEQQLAAAAIARQKLCPVSGKPLGSMGDPVSFDVNGEKLYLCCSDCVNAVKTNPTGYAPGRPPITVSKATSADAAGIANQQVCPVMDEPLGAMGTPIKVTVGDMPIYLCCKGCIKRIQAEPAKYLAKVYGTAQSSDANATAVPAGADQVREGIFKVVAADAPFIAAQKKCPVMDESLDAMGGPYKVNAAGKAIYICCPGCAKKIAAEPQKYLAVLKSKGIEAPVIR
jgi:YHS domain-containing protein